MARKRGEYQRRMERKTRISTVCGLILFGFMIIFSIFGILSCATEIQHIDDGTFKEYTGPYSYEYRKGITRRNRRVNYYTFTLGNGDTFSISSRNSRYNEMLDENPVIHVQYVQDLFGDEYACLSVATPDGSFTIRSLENSRESRVEIIWFLSVMIAACSTVSALLVILSCEQQIRRFKRWRKKRRKMQAQIDASK